MTALRREAVRLVEALPEESLGALILYLNEHKRKEKEREERILQNRKAFDELMSLCRPGPERDYEKELAESREERFGNARID